MVLTNLKSIMELDSGIIIALHNVHTKARLEPAGDKQTQVDIIQS